MVEGLVREPGRGATKVLEVSFGGLLTSDTQIWYTIGEVGSRGMPVSSLKQEML